MVTDPNRPATLEEWQASPPDTDGWWLFREDGMTPERILVIRGHVADDEEWERAMGRPPSDVICENYWEGCDVIEMTNGKLNSGVWKRDSAALQGATHADMH